MSRWLPLLAALVALLFVAAMLVATSGHFVPQVVDLYLICQYARAWAEGHPFQYNAGEAPSTGATSFLWTLLLGLGHLAGARGEGLVAVAILLGAVCFVASVVLAGRLGKMLAGPREAALAAALLTFGGPVVWGYLYGSDIAPFMLLSLWLFERLVAGASRGAIVVACLLVLLRPEGLAIAAVLFLRAVLRRPRVPVLGFAVPVGIGLALVVLNRWLTGGLVGSSVGEKALVATYGPLGGLALASGYATDVIRGVLLGLYPGTVAIGHTQGWAAYFFPPLGLLLALLALVDLPAEKREPVRTWCLILVFVSALVLPNVFMGVHFHRYLMWAFPSLLVMTAVGTGALARLLARTDVELERRIFGGLAALAVVLGLLSTARFAALYGESAGDIFRREIPTARWIKGHLPQGVAIANVATSIEYLTGHRNFNLHGVTSPAFFGNRTAEREAGMFEALGRLPAAERPPYLLATVSGMQSSEVLEQLVVSPPLYQSLSFTDELVLYRMTYGAIGDPSRILPQGPDLAGREEVDRLNVCDSASEAAHEYEVSSHLGDLRLHGGVKRARYAGGSDVMDAGRAVFGEEQFTVRTRKGKDLLLVMRTTSAVPVNVRRTTGANRFVVEIPHPAIEIKIGGETIQRLEAALQSEWSDVVVRLPGAALREERTRLTIRGRYASFHYWFFQ